MTTTTAIELPIDLNTMDDTGLPWTFLDQAADPLRVVPGAHLGAGSGTVRGVVVVVDVTEDGIAHVCDVPGSVEDNAHLLGDRSVSRLHRSVFQIVCQIREKRAVQAGMSRHRRRREPAHNPKVAGSIPAPAAIRMQCSQRLRVIGGLVLFGAATGCLPTPTGYAASGCPLNVVEWSARS